jgi:rhomboid protease GluP
VIGPASDEPPPRLDRWVEKGLTVLGAAGFNTTRLRWRWNRFRLEVEGRRAAAENRFRGVTSPHRMCAACRALVPAGSRTCSECGAALSAANAPGLSRLASWALPGVPPVTVLLLTANFGLFAIIGARAGFASGDAGGGPQALFHLLSFDSDTLVRYGSGNNVLLLDRAEWWRLICPIFLHAGLLHLLFNTFIFVQIAPLMEQEYGRHKFTVLYILTGIGAFLASEVVRGVVFHRLVNTVGASGAIFGLVGAALVYGLRRGGAYGGALRSMMTRWTIYALVMGFLMPGTDNFAHLGGLASGALFAAVVRPGDAGSGVGLWGWRVAAFLAAGGAIAAFALAGWEGNASLEAWRALVGRS